MTNEEIEKRFKFDLEMELFKTDPSYEDKVISFKDFNSYSPNNVNNLISILRNMSYETLELNEYSHSFTKNLLMINTKFKIYMIRYSRDPQLNYLEKEGLINQIPDYIKEYKRWLMKKLKRDFYLT